jgi:cytochrome c biogenesis protein CcmG, thiol:disulfide interchange protein DsbE
MRRSVWIIAAAVVVAAGVIAVAASGSGGKKTTTTSTSTGGSAIAEVRPVTVVGTRLPSVPSSGHDPAVGATPPELHGQTFDGQPFDVSNDGQPKIVLMVAHWCPHCQREVPLLANYFRGNGLPAGVRIVTVATDTKSNLSNYPPSAWLSRAGWPVPVMADEARSTAAAAYGLNAFPYFCAIDAKNQVVKRTTGELTLGQFLTLVSLARGS